MIYLDVTGGCLLPLQSGIPRTTRGTWRLLRESGCRVRPICWQPFRGRYTRLSSRARRLLESSASLVTEGKVPRDSTGPLLWASFTDLRSWPDRVSLNRLMDDGDVLLLTSLFPDNRLGYLHQLVDGPGRKMAIFHDAIPLRDANVAGWERARHVAALRLLARMDLVIAVSEAARMDLLALWQEHKIGPAPTRTVAWPVPFTRPRPEFTPPSGEPKRILYVSRLKAVKNHATLLAACEKLWSEEFRFELELIGCEDEARESRAIRLEIQSLQRRGRPVSWRAHVSEEELHLAYQRASFTVFPSIAEGFGLPIIESLWHGRPVICSEAGPMGELSRDGGCVTVDVRNADHLAAAISSLLTEASHLFALAQTAYARPVRTWTQYGAELMAMLEAR